MQHFIDTLDDPRLDVYRNVRHTNLTRWSGRFIAEGRLVVERLLASDFTVESVLVSERRRAMVLPTIKRDVDVLVVPQPIAEELVGYNFHAGVLACGRRKMAESFESVAEKPGRLTIVICHQVTGPENLGALIRLGHGFGVDGIVLGPGSVDPFARRVIRVSMGSVFRVPIVESRDLAANMRTLAARYGVETWGMVAAAEARPLAACQAEGRVAVLFGNEFEGLPAPLLELCARRVTIPMSPGADSLNLAAAAAIALYEVTRGKV